MWGGGGGEVFLCCHMVEKVVLHIIFMHIVQKEQPQSHKCLHLCPFLQ